MGGPSDESFVTLWTGRISFAIVEAVAVDLSAAKVGQNPGAKTKMTSNRKLGLGTDIAHLFLYDPDRLDYAKTWPIDWFNAPEVWQHVSRAGDMVAWCTRSDGGYAVRLTTDGLTEAETPLAGASWTFPLRSTGRVLIDGGDLLPNEDRAMGEPHDDQWVELAPGLWHVTVTAIEWTASALPEEEASKLFANYVVSFAPAGDAPAPAIARRPPDLVCLRAEPANDSPPEPIPAGASARKGPDLSAPMPAGQAAKVVAPPGHFTSEGESDLLMSIPPGVRTFDAFKLPYFMAPSLEVGAVGQVCRLSGSGGAPGKPPRFSLTAQATARLTILAIRPRIMTSSARIAPSHLRIVPLKRARKPKFSTCSAPPVWTPKPRPGACTALRSAGASTRSPALYRSRIPAPMSCLAFCRVRQGSPVGARMSHLR
jgi:hypothetical protein